jgi:hypothetical protein
LMQAALQQHTEAQSHPHVHSSAINSSARHTSEGWSADLSKALVSKHNKHRGLQCQSKQAVKAEIWMSQYCIRWSCQQIPTAATIISCSHLWPNLLVGPTGLDSTAVATICSSTIDLSSSRSSFARSPRLKAWKSCCSRAGSASLSLRCLSLPLPALWLLPRHTGRSNTSRLRDRPLPEVLPRLRLPLPLPLPRALLGLGLRPLPLRCMYILLLAGHPCCLKMLLP